MHNLNNMILFHKHIIPTVCVCYLGRIVNKLWIRKIPKEAYIRNQLYIKII